MRGPVRKEDVRKLVGQQIVAITKDGTRVEGKLVRISGQRLIVKQSAGKKLKTKAIIPLVLFDLLAIGTAPYAYGAGAYGVGAYGAGGGLGLGYGGFPGYPQYPYIW